MKARWILSLITLLILTACEQPESADAPAQQTAPDRPLVVASNFPLAYFAERIAGDSVEVVFPEIDGDPAFWEPGSDQIALLQSADLVLLNGAGYESWLNWVSLRDDRLLDTSASFTDRLIPLEQETVHQHGPSGEHSHAGMAFTIWLDSDLAAEQAKAIEQGLLILVPDQAEQLESGLAALLTDLESLDATLAAAFQPHREKVWSFSHPVYQYLARNYALDGFSVHWEPEVEPSMQDWLDFREAANESNVSLMFWEGEPLQETRDSLEQMDIRTIVFDPVGNAPPGSDYFELMEDNASRLMR